MMFNQDLLRFRDLKSRCYNAIQMTALCTYAGHLEYLLKSNNKLISLFTLPVGLVWGVRRIMQFAKL